VPTTAWAVSRGRTTLALATQRVSIRDVPFRDEQTADAIVQKRQIA